MTSEELCVRLAKWIGMINESEPPQLTRETHLVNDLSLDSLALAELAAKVRSELKIKIKPTEIANDLRVGPLIDLVLARLAGGE